MNLNQDFCNEEVIELCDTIDNLVCVANNLEHYDEQLSSEVMDLRERLVDFVLKQLREKGFGN